MTNIKEQHERFSTGENCIRGSKNTLRIDYLETNMRRLQKAMFWLTTSSFTTLASLVVYLIVTIVGG